MVRPSAFGGDSQLPAGALKPPDSCGRVEHMVTAEIDCDQPEQVLDLISAALARVGEASLDHARQLSEILYRDLHIRTPEHLHHALFTEETELEDLRAVVKGRLLTALKFELRLWEQYMHERVDAPLHRGVTSPAKRTRAQGKRQLQLEVARVDLIQLSHIDLRQRSFTAQVFVQFRFPNGALDQHLAAPSEEFPVDAQGRPREARRAAAE